MVRGTAQADASDGLRFVCYCSDCRAFARFLDRSDILDAAGGTDIYQMPPARLTIATGSDQLRCTQLSDRVLRWYTACCRTPIGNTAVTPRFPLVAVIHTFMDHGATGQSRDAALGPPRCALFARSATAPLPRQLPSPALALFARRGAMMLRWWLGGLARPSPFFDPRTGRPRAAPQPVARGG
jgi:hypothetical protein